MQTQTQLSAERKPFATSEAYCTAIFEHLNGGSTHKMDHSEMEVHILAQSREMARLMMQDALDLASDHGPLHVVGSDGVMRTHQRRSARPLQTLVGSVSVERQTYAARGSSMLAPLDTALNLPPQSYSFGVRRHVAEQVALVSYDASIKTVYDLGAIAIPKRQAEEQTAAAARDFDAFYAQRKHAPQTDDASRDAFMVISVDGKGIVMRPDQLSGPTRKHAASKPHKLDKRLSKGEKKDRKRMAQVAAVYTVKRHVRSAEDIVKPLRHVRDVNVKPAPKPRNKRVWASIKKPMEGVNSDVFDEALARDPQRQKTWIALVDGNKQQLGDIMALAEHHKVAITPIIDIIHVIQYLWLAAWCFHSEGDKEAQKWVDVRLLSILKGQSSQVAAGIRRSATNRKLATSKRRGADRCANYLLKYRNFLHYDVYLQAGMPIATGVIEGACRHLVKDRMDITGARWGIEGAEAVLRMRALVVSGDVDEYWAYHQECEYKRNHAAYYSDNQPPELALKATQSTRYGHLKCIK